MASIWLGCVYVANAACGPYIEVTELRDLYIEQGRTHELRAELLLRGLPTSSREVTFLFFLTLGVIVALGALLAWHVFLITTAQSTIEFYKNKARRREAREAGGHWRNPFNLGWQQNWCNFLGLRPGVGWSAVLLPSAHPPLNDGLHWEQLKIPSSEA